MSSRNNKRLDNSYQPDGMLKYYNRIYLNNITLSHLIIKLKKSATNINNIASTKFEKNVESQLLIYYININFKLNYYR